MASSAPARGRLGHRFGNGDKGTINPSETPASYRTRGGGVAAGETTMSAHGVGAPGMFTREKLFTVVKGAVGAAGLAVLALGAFAPHLSNSAIFGFAGLVLALSAIAGCLVVSR
jgi:hypothetical protein